MKEDGLGWQKRNQVRKYQIKKRGKVIWERMSASIEQIWNIVASRPKSVFIFTFIIWSSICSNKCGVVFVVIIEGGKEILFRVGGGIIFVRHTFPMSKSSINTKTVLTMTDTTESTELQAFKIQKDGYKVTVKISLCICIVLSWDELKVRQNLLGSHFEI